MISLFVRQCLLFQSKDNLFRFFGVFVWIDILVLIYALTRLINTT